MESGFQENSFLFLMIIGILFMLAFALAFVLFVNYSQKKILSEQMQNQQQAYQHQEELLHSTILTQEAERKRIARDLHDEIGSKLNVIFLNIHRLREPNMAKEEINTITNEVETIINTTLETTRRISHDLLPPTLEEFGLIEAVRELQHHFNQSDKLYIDLQLLGNIELNDSLVELNLFRVLQELINNSLRHGKATELNITLEQNNDAIKLAYQDNGSGFHLEQLAHKRGLGMKNIESRLHMMKANFNYDTAPKNGFKMNIELNS